MTKLIKKPIFITITAFVFFLIFSAYSYASSISSDLSKQFLDYMLLLIVIQMKTKVLNCKYEINY